MCSISFKHVWRCGHSEQDDCTTNKKTNLRKVHGHLDFKNIHKLQTPMNLTLRLDI